MALGVPNPKYQCMCLYGFVFIPVYVYYVELMCAVGLSEAFPWQMLAGIPFPANVLILYPLKIPENLWFSGGIKWEHLPETG